MIDAGQFQGQADGGQGGHRPGKRRGLPAAVPVPTCRAVPVVPTIDAGKPVIDLASAGAFPRPCPCRRSTAGNSASWSSCRPWCRRSTPGKRAESGQGWSSTWQRAAVPVVPTIDGGKLTPASWSSCRPWCRRSTPASWSSCRRASAVIDLASAGAFPRPCPCRRSTPGKRASRASRSSCRGPRGADDRRRQAGIDLASAGAFPAAVPVLTIDGGQLGKLVIVPRSSTWQRVAVPVVPMIDAGQFQGQADGGQGGHRPGKRRAFPRPCPCRRVAAVPVVPTIDAGKPVIDLASAGAFPRPCPCRRSTAGNSASWSSCRGPPGVDDRRREADAGKLVIVPTAARSSTWQRAAVPVVPMIDAGKRAESGQAGHRPGNVPRSPWCRRSTPASSKGKLTAGKPVIDLASAGPSRGRARADVPAVPVVPTIDGGKLTPASWSSCRPWCR